MTSAGLLGQPRRHVSDFLFLGCDDCLCQLLRPWIVAMRERCAKVADDSGPDVHIPSVDVETPHDRAVSIAEKIRSFDVDGGAA